MQNAVRDLRQRGFTATQIMQECGAEIARQCRGGLTLQEYNAVADPTSKRNAEELEKLVASGVGVREGWDAGLVRCTFDRVAGRRQQAGTIYVRDVDGVEELVERLESAMFLNATHHNLGFDVGRLVEWDAENNKMLFELRQVKMGHTPIGCARGASNANSSMLQMVEKMAHIEEIITDQLAEQWGTEVDFIRIVDTPRPVNANAENYAQHNHVTINDADALWQNVWERRVQNAARAIHGANAKTLGQ